AYGRTKSGRKNVKQIQVGVNVTGDGGVPAAHAPLDGNAAEAPTHLDNLRRLKEILPPGKLLDIADTKLDTPANLLAVAARGGQSVGGGRPARRCNRFISAIAAGCGRWTTTPRVRSIGQRSNATSTRPSSGRSACAGRSMGRRCGGTIGSSSS